MKEYHITQLCIKSNYLRCSDDFQNVVNLPRAKALAYPYIAPNNQSFINVMLLDIDRPDAGAAWIDAGLHQPNFITQNPVNGHCHYGFALAQPVCISLNAKMKPQRLFARIQHDYTLKLGADRAYAGFLTKTPNHPNHRTIWGRDELFTLDELNTGDDLPLFERSESLGLGRNVTLFDDLRLWAYRERLRYDNFEKWYKACEWQAQGFNTFKEQLPFSEVKATAKSVATWTWKNVTHSEFAKIQSARGKKSGIIRASKSMDSLAEVLRLDK